MVEKIMKKTTLAVSTVLVLAILSGIVVMVYGNRGTVVTTATPTVECGNNDYTGTSTSNAVSAQYVNENNEIIPPQACGWRRGFGRGGGRGWGPGGFIEVSQEFKDKVINIMKADPDVQKLIADGYNITEAKVNPIIKAVVGADGSVVIKATNATVTLRKDTTGRATVWVNVEAEKVTRIEILTRTVIEKP